MEQIPIKKWYQRKVSSLVLFAVFILLASVLNLSSSSPVSTQQEQVVQIEQVQATESVQSDFDTKSRSTASLYNSNYYTNVDGNRVHSPAYSSDNSIPAGATAQCRDGSYSFSQNRRGTCSRHGGVANWL